MRDWLQVSQLSDRIPRDSLERSRKGSLEKGRWGRGLGQKRNLQEKLLHLRIRVRWGAVGVWKDPTQTRAHHPWKNNSNYPFVGYNESHTHTHTHTHTHWFPFSPLYYCLYLKFWCQATSRHKSSFSLSPCQSGTCFLTVPSALTFCLFWLLQHSWCCMLSDLAKPGEL